MAAALPRDRWLAQSPGQASNVVDSAGGGEEERNRTRMFDMLKKTEFGGDGAESFRLK